MSRLFSRAASLILAAVLAGCSATHHVEDVRAEGADRVTVGTVQKEIKLGMSGAPVTDWRGAIISAPVISSTV